MTGGGVTVINAELRVGGLQETITVPASRPSSTSRPTNREQVLSNEFVRALPASRGYGNYFAGVPASPARASAPAPRRRKLLHLARRPQREGNIQIDG